MANKQIHELNPIAGMDGTELFLVVDASGNSRKLTMAELKTIVPSNLPYRGARVRRTANLNIANSTSVAVSWQSDAAPEARDTDGIWNIGSPTRLVVPTGVTKVRLQANITWANSNTAGRYTWMTKNGEVFDGRGLDTKAAYGSSATNLWSAVIDVVGGDYFELWVFQDSGGTLALLAANSTWFAMDIIELS